MGFLGVLRVLRAGVLEAVAPQLLNGVGVGATAVEKAPKGGAETLLVALEGGPR